MFGKKATTAEEVLKLFSALSDEEKSKFLGAVNGEDKEEEPTEETATEETLESEPVTENKEGGEGEKQVLTNEENTEKPEAVPVETEGEVQTEGEVTETEESITEENAPPAPDNQAVDNTAQILEGFGTRLTAIEETLKRFTELKELMEKFTQAQADKFGYSGTVPGGKKDYGEMGADELKSKILSGEI